MKRILPYLVVLSFLVGGCSGQVLEPVYEPQMGLSLYFCPEDDCTRVFLDEIENSKVSLDCAFFDLDNKQMINAFSIKSEEIPVRIVIDHQNYEGQMEGSSIKKAKGKQYMHNKFCVIDSKRVITGSVNPTTNELLKNKNNLLVIDSTTLASNYADEFEELWNGVYAAGNPVLTPQVVTETLIIENYFCPEDNCQGHAIEALQQANESISFMTFSFTDKEIADVIMTKPVSVRGIFDSRSAAGEGSQYERMQGFGFDVHKDAFKGTMHHKVFIIDNKTVITGSYNPTGSGNTRNDENMLIIHNEVVGRAFAREFEELYEGAISKN